MGAQVPIEKYKAGTENKYPINEVMLAISINQPTNLIVSWRAGAITKEFMQISPNKIKLTILIKDGIPSPKS